MKHSGISVLALLILFVAGTAMADAPLDGDYQSTDLGGPVLTGRYTEAWDAGGGATENGTTLNAQSWDGALLATQWKYWCGTEVSAVMLTNTVNASGNGARTYMKTFEGGYIWLAGSGPWGNGDPDYYGTIDYYVEFETISYSNWVPIAAVTNVQANAHFDDYPAQCMTFYIGNGARMASTEVGDPILPDYPELLDPDCNATRTEGACWDFFSVTLSISGCTIDAEDASWGKIKSIHSE
ncbi:MAG: hypothetical protein JXB45_01725 [Candidatus Krumholzibacteriota bacterium]|nr:hypothetical protein [Candidatus Krumholzibacteriota bacterium]